MTTIVLHVAVAMTTKCIAWYRSFLQDLNPQIWRCSIILTVFMPGAGRSLSIKPLGKRSGVVLLHVHVRRSCAIGPRTETRKTYGNSRIDKLAKIVGPTTSVPPARICPRVFKDCSCFGAGNTLLFKLTQLGVRCTLIRHWSAPTASTVWQVSAVLKTKAWSWTWGTWPRLK